MGRTTKRAAIVAVLALLLAGFSAATSAPSASGQSGDEESRPRVRGVSLAEVTPASARGTVHPGSPGSGDESGATATTGGTEGIPAGGGETVSLPDGRIRVTDAQAVTYPHRAIGQIEYEQNGHDFICTGWLIDPNTILTAGHCAYDPNGSTGDIIEFARFFPGRYRQSNGVVVNPFGFCDVDIVAAPIEWRMNGSEYADYAIMNFAESCDIGNDVGFLGFFYVTNNANPNILAGLSVRVEGYPGDKPFGSEWYMGGLIAQSQKKMIFYRHDTYAGQSGSPVFQLNRPGCGPCSAGIHAYGFPHSTGPHRTYNHGPRFTAARFNYILDIAVLNDP
jgi:glutamyl endopeptidase